MDFLGDALGKSLPVIAGGMGSVLDLGASHMPWGHQAHTPQLLKPEGPRARAPQHENHQNEKLTHRNERVAFTRHNYRVALTPRSKRKPMCSKEDPVHPKEPNQINT